MEQIVHLLDLGYYGQPIITVEKIDNGLVLISYNDGNSTIRFNDKMLETMLEKIKAIKPKLKSFSEVK